MIKDSKIKELVDSYSDQSLDTVDPLLHIYLKPSMYLGSIETPLHTLEEALMNSIDEAKIGVSKNITITLFKDNRISVKDDGRGIPPYYSEKFGEPTVRSALTRPNTGKAFSNNTSGTSQHGIGMKAVVATSDFLKVKVWRDGYIHQDEYQFKEGRPGIPVVELINNRDLPKEKIPKNDKMIHGTEIIWMPSKTVFDTTSIDFKSIERVCHDLAFLVPGVKITLISERKGETKVFQEDGGISSLLEKTIKSYNFTPITPVFNIEGVYNTGDKTISGEDIVIKARISFVFTNNTASKVLLFTNNVPNPQGGTPVKGIKTGVSRLINKYAKDLSLSKTTIEQQDILPGFIAVIDQTHPSPSFNGQAKKEITSANSYNALNVITYNESQLLFDRSIDFIKLIIKNAQKRESLRKKESEKTINFKDKELINLTNKKINGARNLGAGKGSELFIVEGESAGGTVVDERFIDYQAVIAIRGKVINSYKSSAKKLRENAELVSIFSAIGTGIGSDFDINKRNYDKIIITTDQDPDGANIAILLLSAFAKFTPELISGGYVYKVLTPLFVNTLKNKDTVYTYSNKEQEEFLQQNKNKVLSVSRNKGLGELPPELVFETIIDNKTRKLIRVDLNEDNFVESYEMVEKMMGSSSEARRELFFDKELYS